MSVDPAIVVAVVAGSASLIGPPATWWLARRNHSATAELTEAQAEQVRGLPP